MITNLGDDGKLPKNTEAEYADLYFLLQYPSTLDHIDEDEAAAAVPMPELGFLTDLSGYEQYLNPGNTPEYLTLVNVTHNLDSTYVPPDLTSVVNTRNDGRQTQQMRLYAEKALEAMFIELKAAGYEDASVTSGYRSYATQEYNFNNRKQQYIAGGMSEADAYATTATIINPPGSSEHQSGLCADLHNLPAAGHSLRERGGIHVAQRKLLEIRLHPEIPGGQGEYHRHILRTVALSLCRQIPRPADADARNVP